jgi:hypothetical protein
MFPLLRTLAVSMLSLTLMSAATLPDPSSFPVQPDLPDPLRFLSGAPVAKLSQANGGLVQRDLRRAHQARQILREIPGQDLIARLGKAAELYEHGALPLGDGAGDFGGWFCPCHGSHYDTAGRIRRGPAPRNLPVPVAAFTDETTIKLG